MVRMKRIGVLTSGGDCPGLNACLRAVVRTAIAKGCEVVGFCHGYEGLMAGEQMKLDHRAVSGVIHQGGTLLHSARSQGFRTLEGCRKAAQTLESQRIEGLIIIGGNGSLQGASELTKYTAVPIVGIPKSIDNDIGGTDFAIGFDTAVNTAVQAIDKIRDTATSHDLLFLVEVMGRNRGFLALAAAIAGGAEDVLVPETPTDIDALCQKLEEGKLRGKTSSIIVVAEGEETGGAFDIARAIRNRVGYETRVSVIGHQQRGGSPSAFDRVLASRFGQAAVEGLLTGRKNQMIGWVKGDMVFSNLETAWKVVRPLDPHLLQLIEILS